MTEFNNNNNKFVPQAPKTFQILELRDQQQVVKKSSLSAEARNKVINRSGSNYLSENEGYGPCFASFSGECNCNFSISATLIDKDGNSRSQTIRPTSYRQVADMASAVNLGWGEWKVDSGSSFFGGTNHFNPSQTARVKLATEIDNAAYEHGRQNITVAENSILQGITITVNGFRR